MVKIKINDYEKEKRIKTTFQCPEDIRDRLEGLCNENNQYNPDDVLSSLIDEGLKKLGY